RAPSNCWLVSQRFVHDPDRWGQRHRDGSRPSRTRAPRVSSRGSTPNFLAAVRRTPMRWNFLKKCWPLPIREALRPSRRKVQPAKPRVRLWLEELESRAVPTTITRTSASIYYNDLKLSQKLTSEYASYQITNNDGVDHANVWVTIGNFTSADGSAPL